MIQSESVGWPRFRILALLSAMFLVAIWSFVLRIVPHIAIAIAGIVLPVLFTASLVRIQRQLRHLDVHRLQRFLLVIVWMLTAGSWAFGYVVSIGPVIGMANYMGISPGNNALEAIYAPVIWLHDVTPLSEPLDEYCRAWGFQ